MIRALSLQFAIRRKLKREHSTAEYRHLKKQVTYRFCNDMLNTHKDRYGSFPMLESMAQFVIDNWEEILRVILTLASLVLDENDA